jgi:DNA-3-methyladenine glycosylase I
LIADEKVRCPWALSDPLLLEYHDKEWGVPVHNDSHLFEFLILEGAQAGLSWLTILRKRDNYRKVFDGFDPVKVSRFREARIEKLKKDSRIIRNELKIRSAVKNARGVVAIQKEYGSFDKYIWSFAKRRSAPLKSLGQIPAKTVDSDAMSKDLQKKGFSFVGSTICYAFMQATGLVNDHISICFRAGEV